MQELKVLQTMTKKRKFKAQKRVSKHLVTITYQRPSDNRVGEW